VTTTATNGRSAASDPLAYLARHWPGPGRRNDAYKALCGGLLRDRLPPDRVRRIVEGLAQATHDEEIARRADLVEPTAERIRQHQPATGWPALAKLLGDDGASVVAHFRRRMGLAIAVADLARHKRLPVEFLEAHGLHDLPLGGVGIPYRDAGGRTVAVKERYALRAGDGSRWPKGRPLMAYGEHRLEDAQRAGHQVIVEGETDALTLWFHGEPALGLPGAETAAKTLHPGHVAGRPLIYVVQEPDAAGTDFVANVAARLAGLGWRGALKVVKPPVKDVSELHVANPDGFDAAWRKALDEAQPVPLPPPGGDAPPWPEPAPLAEVPVAADFPVDVFPAPLRQFVSEAARAFPCPPDYLAVPLLAMAAGALGASRAVAIKPGHVQSGRLYAGVIGPPGSAKTPAQEAAVSEAHEEEEQLHAAWETAMERHQADADAYEADLKEWKKRKADERGDPPRKPERPPLKRLTVNEVTTEALVPILRENPRGVVLVRDELLGWVQSMNCYREGGKGADQQFWLSAWSGSTVTVDRKKTHDLGPLRVRHPFVGVIGGLVPDKLSTLRGDRPRQKAEQDGFLDRLLLSYPREPRVEPENWLEVADATLQAMQAVLRRLRTVAMIPLQEGGEVKGWRPFVVKLTACGRQEWKRFTEDHARQRNADAFPDHLAGPWSKLRGYCGRLALVVHYLRWAGGELEDPDAGVDGESMARAAKLVAYFKSHARKVYAVMDGDPRVSDARKILRWVLAHRPRRFQKRDAYQGLKGTFKTVEDLEPGLAVLVQHGLLRLEAPSTREGPGRKPSPYYEVNPHAPSQNSHYPHNGPDPDDRTAGVALDDPDGPDSGDSGNCGDGPGERIPSEGPTADDAAGPHSEDCGDSGNTPRQENGAADGPADGVVVDAAPGGESTPEIAARASPQFPLSSESTPARDAGRHRVVVDAEGLEAVRQALADAEAVGLDCETTGLDPRRDRVRLLQLSVPTIDGGHFTYVVDCFRVDPAPLWEGLAATTVVAHHAAFDVGMLAGLGFVPGRVCCTQLLSRLVYGTRRPRGFHELRQCVERELGRSMDKAQQLSDWSGALSREQLDYAARDAEVLLPLYTALTAKVNDSGQEQVAEIESRCLPAVVWLARSGAPVDRDALTALIARMKADAAEVRDLLDAAAPPRPGTLLAQGAWNWRSGEQIKEVFGLLGIALKDTRHDTLQEVEHPLAQLLLRFKAVEKRLGTYGDKWLRRVGANGRVYAGWNQLGSAAGRMSCTGPNLQQLPRGKAYRQCIQAPPGRLLLKADYSQIELRIAAKVAGDQAMLAAYRHGEDIHVRTAISLAHETALRSTALLCLWAGVPADRTGTEILRHLWTGPAARTDAASQLRLCRKNGTDSVAGGGIGGSPDEPGESPLERWCITAAAAGLPEALLRAVREHPVRCGPSSGSQPAIQCGLELRDALSILPCVGTRTLAELDPAWPGLRQLAKACGFGLLYGMGPGGFGHYAKSKYGVELTEQQAGDYRTAFFDAYPGLAAWHRTVKRAHAAQTRTLAGRRRLLDAQEPDTYRLNSPVQGTGADGLKLALALLWERRGDCPGAFPVLAVHDELVVEADAAQADAAAEWLRAAMIDAMAPLIDPVPVEVEVTVARTWGGDA
jgi:DNA polymerase I-like protein with 3'-5' exonuclease and polymerase domains